MTVPGSPPSARARAALAERAEKVLGLRQDPGPWIEANLWIRDKERRVIPFHRNWAQFEYWDHRTNRDLILKARQMGMTTAVSGLYFADCLLRPNTTSVIVAHDLESAQRIFRIVGLFWEQLPAGERRRVGKTRFSNRQELLWPRINSHFYVGTAGNVSFGRGMTINNLHCSEYAFWPRPEESLAALLQAVPQGGRVIIESTANGIGNPMHTLWQEAEQSGFARHLYVWWEDPGYRLAGPDLGELDAEEQSLRGRWGLDDDQLRWRRAKRRELRDLFRQEYPEDDVSCFLASTRACFDLDALQRMAARIAAEPPGHALTGIPARDGPLAVAPARLRVWRQPQEGRYYAIGADVGEGLAGGDASCGVVLDRESGEQVAELHGRISPDRFARLLAALGSWYRFAEVAVERNNHGHSTLNTLRNVLHYPRLYHHVRYDHRVGNQLTLGWPTDTATKPILVDGLAAAVAEEAVVLHSADLVDECMSFVTTDSGSQEAQAGAHDDRVMALGIAWQVRKRPVSRGTAERPPGW